MRGLAQRRQGQRWQGQRGTWRLVEGALDEADHRMQGVGEFAETGDLGGSDTIDVSRPQFDDTGVQEVEGGMRANGGRRRRIIGTGANVSDDFLREFVEG